MNDKLISQLVCPVTHTPLEWDKANNRLISRMANLVYPIENGIFILLPEAGKAFKETPQTI